MKLKNVYGIIEDVKPTMGVVCQSAAQGYATMTMIDWALRNLTKNPSYYNANKVTGLLVDCINKFDIGYNRYHYRTSMTVIANKYINSIALLFCKKTGKTKIALKEVYQWLSTDYATPSYMNRNSHIWNYKKVN